MSTYLQPRGIGSALVASIGAARRPGARRRACRGVGARPVGLAAALLLVLPAGASAATYHYQAPGRIVELAANRTSVGALVDGPSGCIVVRWRPGYGVVRARASFAEPSGEPCQGHYGGHFYGLHFSDNALSWTGISCGNDCYKMIASWWPHEPIAWRTFDNSDSGDIGDADDVNLPRSAPPPRTLRLAHGRVQLNPRTHTLVYTGR